MISSFFKGPQTEMFESFLIRHILQPWNHSRKSMLHTLKQRLVLSIVRRPGGDQYSK